MNSNSVGTTSPTTIAHYYYLDRLRVFACVAVVSSHVIVNPKNYFNPFGNNMIIIYDFIRYISCYAVPIFLMITGCLLLDSDKIISIKKLFARYIVRILAIIAVFGTLFNVIENYFLTKMISAQSIVHAFFGAINGDTWEHMWYLYVLIGLYLFVPVFKCMTMSITQAVYQYLLVILLAASCIFPFINIFIQFDFKIPLTSVYVFYLFLGLYIRKYSIDIKMTILLFWCGLILIIIGTIINNLLSDKFAKVLIGYTGIGTVCISIGIFSFFKCKMNQPINKFVKSISDCSMGIYILHMIFVNFIVKYMNFSIYDSIMIVSFLIETFLVFCGSYFVTLVIRKIPYMNKLF